MKHALVELCAEHDLEVPSDAVVLAILDGAQQVQLLHHQAAAYGPDTLDTELIWAQFVLWTLTPPSSRYMVLLDEEPSQPLAAQVMGDVRQHLPVVGAAAKQPDNQAGLL